MGTVYIPDTAILIREWQAQATFKSYKWLGTGQIALLPEPALDYATHRPDQPLMIGHPIMLRDLTIRVIARHPGQPAYLVMRDGWKARLLAWFLRKLLENHRPPHPPELMPIKE
jgi:hypothetical protein